MTGASPWKLAVGAVMLPAAVMATAEWLAVVASAPGERRYAAHAAGGLLAGQLLAAVLVALPVWLLWRRHRDHIPRRAAAALSPGLAVTLGLLFILPNGLPRRIPPGSLGTGTVVGVALAAGLAAGLLRWWLGPGRPGRGWPVAEPLLVALGLVLPYAGLRLARIPVVSPRGLAVWVVAMVAAAGLGGWLARRSQAAAGEIRLLAAVAPILLAGLVAVGAFLLGRAPYPDLPPRAADRPDVVLVVLDTMRADAIPVPEGSPRPTPALRRLAAEGRRYSHAFSTSCWTVPAHGSLFTGLAPSEHGATWEEPVLPEEVQTLAERFQAAGWRTGGFSANPWITAEFGFDQGFGRFATGRSDLRPLIPWLPALIPALSRPHDSLLMFEDKAGLTLLSEAMRYLGAEDPRPTFLFLNLMEAHLPYLPPRRFLGEIAAEGWDRAALRRLDQDRLADLGPEARRTEREVEGLRLLYAAEAAYADHLVGRLAAALEEAGRLDETILVVTGDHGENLGAHAPLDHQLGLYDTLLRVPLLLRYPARIPAGKTQEGLISLVDVPGLLADLAGLPAGDVASAAPPEGENLGATAPAERDVVFFEYGRPEPILDQIRHQLGLDPSPWDRSLTGIRSRDAKWIQASDGRHQAYDLERDPGEQSNLAPPAAGEIDAVLAGLPEVFAALEARLETAVLQRRLPPETAPRPELSPEAEERLKSLGYIR